jgi:hypothetical protein
LITPGTPLFATAIRTYENRPFRDLATWSYDPVHAARLGLGAEMARSLEAITQFYQVYPNGMADLSGNSGEFYIEQMGVVSVALSEALVQDHGNVIRIGPAIPPDWTVDGSVYVRGNARIAVTAVEGKVTGFELKAGSTREFRIANPWVPGAVITINAKAGKSYAFSGQASAGEASAIATKASAGDTAKAIAATKPDAIATTKAGAIATNTARASANASATTKAGPSAGPSADASAIATNNADTSARTILPATPTNTAVFTPASPTRVKTLGRATIGLAETCCAPPAGYDPTSDRYPTR